MSLATHTTHKPFIDGLRAIAILAVVGIHIGVPHLGGGFVGVDVFFVISGFLIIGQLISALESNRHSLAEFWARRALRILPPYLLVVAASLALGRYVLTSPEELSALGSQVVWSAGMVANHYFLAQQGYFDTGADHKVLLHLWSLAVEEQFYLVAPLLLSAWWALRRRLSGPQFEVWVAFAASAALFAASLVLCICYTTLGEEPNYAFYMMPLRAWEFVLGGMLPSVARLIPARTTGMATALATAGLAAIIGSVVGYDEATPFPSYMAVLPVVGTGAVIAAGLVNDRSWLIRILGSRPLTALGLVSYSWYLWHWPLLALGRIANFGERHLGADALAAVVSLLLAVVTYWLVERPIRLWRQRARPVLGWRVTATGLAACAAMALVGTVGRPTLALGESKDGEEPPSDEAQPEDPCHFEEHWDFHACVASLRGRRLGLVMGDSHAKRFLRYWDKKHADEPVLLGRAVSSACPAIFGVAPIRIKNRRQVEQCTKGREALETEVLADRLHPEFVIMSSYWLWYTAAGDRPLMVEGSSDSGRPNEVFRRQMRLTLKKLLAHGVQRILIVGPTPDMRKDIPKCAAQAKRQGVDVNDACGGRNRSLRELDRARELLTQAARGLERVRLIDPVPSLCRGKKCSAAHGKDLLYTDTHHLSEAAIERIYRRNKGDFEWVLGSHD